MAQLINERRSLQLASKEVAVYKVPSELEKRIIRYEDQHGFYYDSRKLLTLECLDSKMRDLAQMIFVSIRMWIDELLKRGKIDKPPPLKALAPKFRRREDVAPIPTVKFLGQKQEFGDEMIKLFVYDASTDDFRDARPGEKFDTEIKCNAQVGECPFTQPIAEPPTDD